MITVEEASTYAFEKHKDQLDKAKHPYIEHLERVRDALYEHGDAAQIAGVLHDVLEDTDATEEELAEIGVPPYVIEAIASVTRQPGEPYFDMIHRAFAHPLGRIVKLADNKDNSSPERLALLAVEMPALADFYGKRYAKAREILEGAGAS